MIETKNIFYSAGKKSIVKDCSVNVRPGFFTAIVGPNGAGKTSLLKIISREVSRYKGEVLLNGRDVSKIKSNDLSMLRAVLPQHTTVSFPFTIEQVIEIGRFTHKTRREENDAIILEVMQLTSLAGFTGRTYQTLSGGEQQRVQMARVMAQIWDESDSPKYLLLDEPTASLDLSQQHLLLGLAKGLCHRGIGVLAILHDLNLASQYADEVLFLKDGETLAYGPILDVMTKSVIEETFSHPVEVTRDEWTNRPRVYATTSSHQLLKQEQQIKQYAYEHTNHR
jgi:iron complex transport system ATP-binding protein